MEWLDVPDLHRTDGTAWTANLLAPCSSWGDGGTTTNQNWGSQSGGSSGSFSIPWNRPVRVLPVYRHRISENTRAASVTITFKAIFWRACAVHLPAATPSAIGKSIGGMMIGRVWLINNFCGVFLLVVSVSVTFLFAPSLV